MKYRLYTDIPVIYDKKHIMGSSPSLLESLIEELKGAKKIALSFFLYNNPHFHDFIAEVAKGGCKVSIYTIPLNGYDHRNKEVYIDKFYTEKISISKRTLAEQIFNRITNEENINLRIFPHTYVWNTQKFSRGSNLYSLHNKSVYAEFDDVIKCITSSCNFASVDPPHSDNMLVMESHKDIASSAVSMFKHYFRILYNKSFSFKEYEEFSEKRLDVQRTIKPMQLTDIYNNHYFTGPFIKYNGVGSNHYVQDRIIEFILSAKSKIYICAQHFSDISPYDYQAKSLVKVLESINSNIDIKIIKQTRSYNQKQGRRTEEAEKVLLANSHISIKCWEKIIHDKFIVVDNSVLVTTANFTPTQYAWKENRIMTYEVNGREISIPNTFSEVNAFHFINNQELSHQYVDHFNNIWNNTNCISV